MIAKATTKNVRMSAQKVREVTRQIQGLNAVEAQSILKNAFVELVDRDGKVLPKPGKIHESKIDGLHAALATHGQYFLRRHRTPLSANGLNMDWDRW